jgi:hypothetical protein
MNTNIQGSNLAPRNGNYVAALMLHGSTYFEVEELLALLLLFFEDEELRLLPLLVFLGTLAPSLLASERPIAIACFLLVTFLPLLPLLSVPSFFSCMARSTLLPASFEYLGIVN